MADQSILGLAALTTICVILYIFVSCFSFIEQNQYGLMYNWVTKAVGTQVYHGGTHMVGFWNKFIIFPATVQTIEFSDRVQLSSSGMLHTRTKEGLGLHLSISFQYKLDKDRLPQLYALTNMRYEGLFTRIARDQLLEAASEYEGPQYWLRRHDIGAHMRTLVDHQLQAVGASVWGLQLLTIDLPDTYEHAITMTQVQQQIIKTRRNEQSAASIRADTDVLRAEYERQMKVVAVGAEANYTLATRLARAEAERRTLGAEAEALSYAEKQLKMSPADVVKYQEMNAYSVMDNATFLSHVEGLVGVPPAAMSFLQHGAKDGARTNSSARHWHGAETAKHGPAPAFMQTGRGGLRGVAYRHRHSL